MDSSIAVFGLLYGDHHQLHRRLVGSLVRNAPGLKVTVWCNNVCQQTRAYLSTTGCQFIDSVKNVGKYEAMRRLFEQHVPEKWIVWFDDDSHIVADDWLPRMQRYLVEHPDAAYIGQPWNVTWLPGQWEWIRRQDWFRGLPPDRIKQRGNRPGVWFAQGAYWWLRTDIMRKLDWPVIETGLNHNGGDTALAEAVRQQGLPFHHCQYGVKINDALRRGYAEAPVGCSIPSFRR